MTITETAARRTASEVINAIEARLNIKCFGGDVDERNVEKLVAAYRELETRREADDLAHEIAEESEKSFLECNLHTRKDAGGNEWLDLAQITSAERNIGLDYFVDRAVRYLEAQGILKRCPEDSQLIGWDEMDEVPA